jgi:hypothetical protein
MVPTALIKFYLHIAAFFSLHLDRMVMNGTAFPIGFYGVIETLLQNIIDVMLLPICQSLRIV